MTILRHWNSLLGRANASGTRRLARSAPRSPMVGSVNAPEPGFRSGVRWGVVPRCCSPIGRPIGSPPFDTRITRPWSRARQFPISRSERRASSAATPPGPREAGAHGYPGTPNRRPLGAWPNCRPCAECSPPKFIGGLYQTAMGVTLALVPCLPVLGGFPAATPRFAPPCAGPDCGDPPFRRRPPGSGLSCRKTGLNLTSFRGSGRLFRFLAAIRVDGCGITPGRKHSRRRCPVPQPTKPPRTLLGYFADLRTLGIDCLTKPLRTLLGHFRSRIRPSVELPTKPPRDLLGRYVGPRTALRTVRWAYETAQDFARAFGRRALDEHRVTYDAAQNFTRALLRDSLARPTRYARRRDVPPTSGTCTAIGCRCWRRGGSRCRWAHRRVARFRVRRRNPAGQAQGLRSRVALRR